MIRAFLALPVPDVLGHVLTIAQHRLRLDNPVPPENFHVTLAFLDAQPEPVLSELHDQLALRSLPGAVLRLDGFGVFGGRAPQNLHARIAPDKGLAALHERVLGACRAVGIIFERRRFVPHVTLARFRPGTIRDSTLAAHLQDHGPLTSDAVPAPELVLFRSTLRPGGSIYDPLAQYPLPG